jgi:endonuclease YncB( thermonuclease family)
MQCIKSSFKNLSSKYRNYREKRRLNNITDAPLFEIKGKYLAKVVDIYDGDTFKAVFHFNNNYYKFNVRCYGYDSEEIRQPKLDKEREVKKAAGLRDKEALVKLIKGKVVELDILKFDLYGRLLCKVYVDDIYVNDKMIENGNGKPFMRMKGDIGPILEIPIN